ncbi:MAG: C25 family cysteine peptidase [Bacteroidota bacterium]|nr:C25 family cysteine peptidase [Bacteroidota bacterium]
MFRKVLFILIITIFIPLVMLAEWMPAGNNKASNTAPKVTILSDNAKSTVIKVELSGFDLKEFYSEGKHYISADLLTEIFSTKPGFPKLPHIAKVLAIPDQASISIEIIETGEVHIFENIYISPARESWFEGQPESAYIENPKAYQSSEVYPKEYASIEAPSIFRDFRIARLSIFPVRYVPALKELQVVSSITVRLNYGTGEAINKKNRASKAIAPSFAKLYRSFIFNYESVLNSRFAGVENGRELMLCIMPDIFENSFQQYADWKRQSGIDIHVTTFSDIYANANNPALIKNHITDAYNNWEYPPTYVLIIGDNGIFPKQIVNYDYSFPNEDYFVEIEGNDFFPEMMIGRFTNQGDYRMQVMINKYMTYEKFPYTTDTSWFKKGICCSNNLYESQVKTKRFAASLMLDSGAFTSVDTLMNDGNSGGSGCTMDINDVLGAINEGRSYLNYRGEGWSSGWWASCTPFSTSNVSSLNNGEKLTFVTSIGCGVAMFNASGGNCFGEEWIQLGSLTDIRGGVAFVGPVSNTHTTYNNKIDKGIYTGMFIEGLETPGEALLRGKLYMYNVFGNDSWVEYHYRAFTVLGDPSIHIWKDVPLAVNVSHPTSLEVGYNQPEVIVTFASSGLPVANAQVCLTGNDVFVTGYTDLAGKITIDVIPPAADTITVTVRGGNVYPYQGTINIIQTAEHVGPDGNPLILDIDGNTDGFINPGENINSYFTLKNWGLQTASNVEATISFADTCVEVITTNPVSFYNLPQGASFLGNPLQFFVKPSCTVGQTITLQLHVTSNTGSWDYQHLFEIAGCDLNYQNYVVNDDSSAVSNYLMEPGEIVKLFLLIKNTGVDIAPNVMGILRSNDQYITIEDSIGSFGTINIGSDAMNEGDYFEVNIDAACPVGYLGEYTLELYTQGGSYTYQTQYSIVIPVASPTPAYYTGPDAYGYYAYSVDDSIFEQSPVYNWVEIETIGTEINMPGSDYTTTVNLPFTFKYYGIDYTELRICSDGWIAFGSGSQTAYENHPLPNNDNVNCMVAAFWDDLHNTNWEEGQLFYYFDNLNNRFVIEWDSIAHYGDQDNPKEEVFQIILNDPQYYFTPTGDGEIIFQYNTVAKATSITTGIENHAQDVGLQYVYNFNYDSTASPLRNEFAIKFTTEPPFITLSDDEYPDFAYPDGYSLKQNYPNPFSPYTSISYSIPEKCDVLLNIYDVSGQLVKTLQDGKQQAGKYSVTWNGLNNMENKVSSGVYLYRIETEKFTKTMKLFMMK